MQRLVRIAACLSMILGMSGVALADQDTLPCTGTLVYVDTRCTPTFVAKVPGSMQPRDDGYYVYVADYSMYQVIWRTLRWKRWAMLNPSGPLNPDRDNLRRDVLESDAALIEVSQDGGAGTVQATTVK